MKERIALEVAQRKKVIFILFLTLNRFKSLTECKIWSFSPHTRKCYKKFTDDKSWAEAKQHCLQEHLNGNLASIPDQETQNFLERMAQHVWIGGFYHDNAIGWEWTDGTPWEYENWINNPGNKKRMYYQQSGGDGWKTGNGNTRKNFICQYPFDP